MTTTEGSGLIREPGEIFRKEILDAESLNDSGFVLKAIVEATIDKVGKAASGDAPYGINMRSTKDPLDLNFPVTLFLTGSSDRLASIDVVDDGEAGLKVADNNAAIAVGDPLVVAASGGGKVDKYTPTTIRTDTLPNQGADTVSRFKELGEIVGYATQTVVAGSGGNPGQDKCNTRLTIKQVPVIA